MARVVEEENSLVAFICILLNSQCSLHKVYVYLIPGWFLQNGSVLVCKSEVLKSFKDCLEVLQCFRQIKVLFLALSFSQLRIVRRNNDQGFHFCLIKVSMSWHAKN